MGSILRPRQRNGQMTFLYPSSNDLQKHIMKTAMTDPSNVVEIINSLIIDKGMSQLSDFNSSYINRNGHVFSSASMRNGKVLEAKTKYKHWHPVPHLNQNTWVYDYDGQTPPYSDEKKQVSSKKSKKDRDSDYPVSGGAVNYDDSKSKPLLVIEHMKRRFLSGEVDIFKKKVYAQLNYLRTVKRMQAADIYPYLGNEEISDSFLLDMISENNDPFWSDLEIAFRGPEKITTEGNQSISNSYQNLKNDIINERGSIKRDLDYETHQEIVCKVMVPLDIINVLKNAYVKDDNNNKINRDLFIVFTNVCKINWTNTADVTEKATIFNSYIDLILTCGSITRLGEQFLSTGNLEFILSVPGMLLRTDLLRYDPWFSKDDKKYNKIEGNTLPDPNSLSLFNITWLVNKSEVQVSGGSLRNEIISKLFG
jgi:hypothetical protein